MDKLTQTTMHDYFDFTKELKFFVVLPQSIPYLQLSSLGTSVSVPSIISTQRERVIQVFQQKEQFVGPWDHKFNSKNIKSVDETTQLLDCFQALADYDALLSSEQTRMNNKSSIPLFRWDPLFCTPSGEMIMVKYHMAVMLLKITHRDLETLKRNHLGIPSVDAYFLKKTAMPILKKMKNQLSEAASLFLEIKSILKEAENEVLSFLVTESTFSTPRMVKMHIFITINPTFLNGYKNQNNEDIIAFSRLITLDGMEQLYRFCLVFANVFIYHQALITAHADMQVKSVHKVACKILSQALTNITAAKNTNLWETGPLVDICEKHYLRYIYLTIKTLIELHRVQYEWASTHDKAAVQLSSIYSGLLEKRLKRINKNEEAERLLQNESELTDKVKNYFMNTLLNNNTVNNNPPSESSPKFLISQGFYAVQACSFNLYKRILEQENKKIWYIPVPPSHVTISDLCPEAQENISTPFDSSLPKNQNFTVIPQRFYKVSKHTIQKEQQQQQENLFCYNIDELNKLFHKAEKIVQNYPTNTNLQKAWKFGQIRYHKIKHIIVTLEEKLNITESSLTIDKEHEGEEDPRSTVIKDLYQDICIFLHKVIG